MWERNDKEKRQREQAIKVAALSAAIPRRSVTIAKKSEREGLAARKSVAIFHRTILKFHKDQTMKAAPVSTAMSTPTMSEKHKGVYGEKLS